MMRTVKGMEYRAVPLDRKVKPMSAIPRTVYDRIEKLFDPPSVVELTDAYDWIVGTNVFENADEELVDTMTDVNGFDHAVYKIQETYGNHYYYLRCAPAVDDPPVLLWCHPGTCGVDVSCLDHFDNEILPDPTLKNTHDYIVPSYRGEMLSVPGMGVFQSDGSPSIAKLDAVDALRVLHACNMPQGAVKLFGSSRGATVAYLANLRLAIDGISTKTVGAYGGTSCILPYVRIAVLDYIRKGVQSGDRVVNLVLQNIIMPYLGGVVSYSEARMDLLVRSPGLFAELMGGIQIHHGDQDEVVSIEHSDALYDSLPVLGNEYHMYDEGVHSLDSLEGCGVRIKEWLV